MIEFGAIIADGVELSGIAKSEHRNVVALTKRERELNKDVPNNMYVLEDTRTDGIVIWQDEQGFIYRRSPNKAEEKIASSIVEYLRTQNNYINLHGNESFVAENSSDSKYNSD